MIRFLFPLGAILLSAAPQSIDYGPSLNQSRDFSQHPAFVPRSPSMSRSFGISHGAYSGPSNREQLRGTAQNFNRSRTYDPKALRQNAQDFRTSYNKYQTQFQTANRSVSVFVRRHYPDRKNWFYDKYFHKYSNRPIYWRNNVNWWSGAPWTGVNLWLGWKNGTHPIYYYNGYPIEGDSYLPEYPDTAQNSYSPPPDLDNWLPLGVFALKENLDSSSADIFMQLVVNRQGEIAGVYYNSRTDQSFPIEGDVDPSTQEAYWEIPGQVAPELTTGIYNLTQNATSVHLTFPDDTTQNWFLIRINE